jgi:hypothetical protein
VDADKRFAGSGPGPAGEDPDGLVAAGLYMADQARKGIGCHVTREAAAGGKSAVDPTAVGAEVETAGKGVPSDSTETVLGSRMATAEVSTI